MTVERVAAYIPITAEAIEDAPYVHALIEYGLLGGAERPLTLRQRIAGWRTFTDSHGYVLTFRVGWRLRLYWITHPLEWWQRRHPRPENDCD